MTRAAVLVIALASCSLASCAFAKKHPGVTAGIATGMIALVPCLPAVEKPAVCLLVGGGAGLAIGGITGLVTMFADTEAHELPPFEEEEPPIVRVKTHTAPPPGEAPPTTGEPPPVNPPQTPATSPIDAGVPATDASP
jgi:hypothetical protein